MYFFPERGSSDYYIDDIRSFLTSNGFDISVVTPNPVRDLDYDTIEKYKRLELEPYGDLRVYRLYCGSNSSNSVLNRLKRISVYKRKLKKFLKLNHSQFDYIYIPSNPPIFIPLMVESLCKKYGIKSIYAITDLWPQIIGKYNFLKGKSSKAIKCADKVVTLSEDMKRSIQLVSDRKDIEIIRIWPHQSIFEKSKCSSFDYSFLNESKFNIFYIGNIGQFQSIDLLLDVAKEMIGEEKYHFYFVGGGRKYAEISQRVNEESLTNVTIIHRVSNEVASSLYRSSNLNIISLGKGNINYACPSKTSTCIYSNTKCLMIVDKSKYSEELLVNPNFALDSSYDVKHIAQTIRDISADDRVISENNQIKMYDKDVNLNKWLDIFGGCSE